MNNVPLRIGLTASKAPWSGALRAYLRDHVAGFSIDVIMDRAHLWSIAEQLDVVVVDDIMHLLTALDIHRLRDSGVTVYGLYDPTEDRGRRRLLDLGVQLCLSATTPVSELVVSFASVHPRHKIATSHKDRPSEIGLPEGAIGRGARRARVLSWTKVSGGTGSSEAIIAAGEQLAKRSTVLLLELEDAGPVLARRLLRSVDTGLNSALARIAAGDKALPRSLSGSRGDGVGPLGRFDVLCAPAGGFSLSTGTTLGKLLRECIATYDQVLIEAPRLPAHSVNRNNFSIANMALLCADRVVVFASSDPDGAASLVEWRAAAVAAGVIAPCWAVFGRSTRSTFERRHLTELVRCNTGQHPFAGVAFLPEDAIVRRARWNGEMVWKGPWLKQVRSLAAAATAPRAAPVAVMPRDVFVDFAPTTDRAVVP